MVDTNENKQDNNQEDNSGNADAGDKTIVNVGDESLDIDALLADLDSSDEDKKDEPKYITKEDFKSFSDSIVSAISSNNKSNNDDNEDEDDLVASRLDALDEKINESNKASKQFLDFRKETELNDTIKNYEKEVNEQSSIIDFKVDSLHLKLDMAEGLTQKEAMKKQFKAKLAEIGKYSKMFGAEKVLNEDGSLSDVSVSNSMPPELKEIGFDPDIANNPNEFSQLRVPEKREYLKNLKIYQAYNKK